MCRNSNQTASTYISSSLFSGRAVRPTSLEPLACRLLHLQGLGDIFKASLECGIVGVFLVIGALVQIWAKWYTTALTSDDGIQGFLAPSSDSFVCLRSQTLDLIFSTQAMTRVIEGRDQQHGVPHFISSSLWYEVRPRSTPQTCKWNCWCIIFAIRRC
jgi:hypothetical protein